MPPSLKPFDGKFIVRGGQAESLEWDWKPERIVVLEFPNVEKAKTFWNSDGYAPLGAETANRPYKNDPGSRVLGLIR